MSTITRLRCDRCGAESGQTEPEWAALDSVRHGGLSVTGSVDLCEPCTDSLAVWFANPRQFRQLHDLAEATVLFHTTRPWSAEMTKRWRELVGEDVERNSEGLCGAIRTALQFQQVDAP